MKASTIIITLGLLLGSLPITAQKKLIPAVKSEFTGIPLPVGSQVDKRFLSVSAAKMLLEEESKKTGTGISAVEVLYLPATIHISSAELLDGLAKEGWSQISSGGDPKNFWLQKEGRVLLCYFSKDKSLIELYFGEATSPPTTLPVGNASERQLADTSTNLPPEKVGPSKNTSDAAPSSGHGITVSRTNFDDGWTATPEADWVQLKKENIRVLLHYPIALTDDLKTSDAPVILDYFWNLLIAPRYQVITVEKRAIPAFEYPRLYFVQGAVIDKQTGVAAHVGLRIYINSGITSCVEIMAANRTEYERKFPDLSTIDPLLNYNKFAITLADVMGEWQESSGAHAQYYNAYTGNYAGMYGSSISSRLTMENNGQFRFEHKGASGMVGSQTFFSEKYYGKYTVNSFWEIGITDQTGKTYLYDAYYKAVKNGRLLCLQNKTYTGQRYMMVKSK